MAKEYDVNPGSVLAVGVGSGFGTDGTCRKTGDVFGMTGGGGGRMPTVSSPDEDVRLFLHSYGLQIRETGSDADACINALQGQDKLGKRGAGWRRYNSEDSGGEQKLIRSGIPRGVKEISGA